jgi:hypothetical protein
LAEASIYCAGLSLAGTNWRLPSKAELETLVDDTRFNPAIDVTAFPNTVPSAYVTSTPVVSFAGYTWSVEFFTGSAAGVLIDGPADVRCVR